MLLVPFFSDFWYLLYFWHSGLFKRPLCRIFDQNQKIYFIIPAESSNEIGLNFQGLYSSSLPINTKVAIQKCIKVRTEWALLGQNLTPKRGKKSFDTNSKEQHCSDRNKNYTDGGVYISNVTEIVTPPEDQWCAQCAPLNVKFSFFWALIQILKSSITLIETKISQVQESKPPTWLKSWHLRRIKDAHSAHH